MTNEPRWDTILTKNRRKNTSPVKQKDNLETHAKQITQYLKDSSNNDSDPPSDYHDTSLPGVKIPFAFPEQAPPKSIRRSMRKLPRKSSSVKDKKKNVDSVRSKQRKSSSSSPDEEKQVFNTAGRVDSGVRPEISAVTKDESTSDMATHEDRPIITSLDASELIFVSADKGDLGTMQVLLDKPSEHSKSLCLAKDDKGETPLHKTAKGGYLKCLKFLTSHVPHKVSCADNSGLTPAAHAAKNGHINCLKWLVEESSAYVELAVRDGQTSLLHHAAAQGKEQCLNYLLAFMAKRKITTDIIDAQGQTPLHSAAKMGHLACVQTLVEHGADVLAKDNEGLTSTNVAYLQKQSVCSRYLLMAESCWILASRVATLFREVNGFKKENKELKKTVEALKTTKKSGLPNRPETVGAHTNDNDFSRPGSDRTPIGSRDRNFPDGESPKSTFTEADKERPQIISKNHIINRDEEVKDSAHLKVVRQTSNQSDSFPSVSTNGIAEIPPAEKVKAKEIAMVTHQLLSTRHMQMVQDQKARQMNKEEIKPKVSVDDTVPAVARRTNLSRNRDARPKSLCDSDLTFMRSATDSNITVNRKKRVLLERHASCTEIANQDDSTKLDSKDSGTKEKNFWDKVGARKLLSRKKSTKPRPQSTSLGDLQTVSTDKILELYARESRGSSRINSLIWEENEVSPSMGRRTMSSIELKSQASSRDTSVHASFREPRSSNFRPLTDFRMSERLTPSTSKGKDLRTPETNVPEEKKVRPVPKPRHKLKTVNDSDLSKCRQTEENFKADNVEAKFKNDTADSSENFAKNSGNFSGHENPTWTSLREVDTIPAVTDENLECTDV